MSTMNRRAMLGGAAVALASTASAAFTAVAVDSVSPSVGRLIAAFRKADARYREAFGRYLDIDSSTNEVRKSLPSALYRRAGDHALGVPGHQMPAEHVARFGPQIYGPGEVETIRAATGHRPMMVSKGDDESMTFSPGEHSPEALARMAEIVGAHDDHWKRDDVQDAERALALSEAVMNKAADRRMRIADMVVDTPAHSNADVLAKLEVLAVERGTTAENLAADIADEYQGRDYQVNLMGSIIGDIQRMAMREP